MHSKSRKTVLIVNTHSRKANRLYDQVKQLLQAGGIELVASYPVKNPKKLGQTIQLALEHKPDLLVVGSGDGTISEVVDYQPTAGQCSALFRWELLTTLPVALTYRLILSLRSIRYCTERYGPSI